MAEVRGKADHLVLGDYNAICDVCGFKFKASQLRLRWDGFMVCSDDYEQRHPQDLIRGIPDRQIVPWARPVPKEVFTNHLPIIYTEDNNWLMTELGEQIQVYNLYIIYTEDNNWLTTESLEQLQIFNFPVIYTEDNLVLTTQLNEEIGV